MVKSALLVHSPCLQCGRDLGGDCRWCDIEPVIAKGLDVRVWVVVKEGSILVVGAVQNSIALSLSQDVPPRPTVLGVVDSDPLHFNMLLRVAMQNPGAGGGSKREKGGRSQ